MNGKIQTELRNLAVIVAASAIYASGLALFLDPNQLAPGGVSGIAVILSHLIHIETGTLYFWLNVPIMLLGVWRFGVRFITKTAVSIVTTSFFTNILAQIGAVTDDKLIAAASGGILMAVGIGLTFKAGATTGGTDIIIKVLRQKYRHLKTSFLFLCTDLVIVSISGFVFKNLGVMFYALLTVFICGKALDYVLYGGDEAKMLYIITEYPIEIGDRLLKELDAGVTYLEGRGGWTGNQKQVILCAVPKRMGPQVEEVVKEEDPSAFMIVASANEIYGEGYKDFFGEAL